MDKYRILLLDSHKLLMEGVRSILSPFPDIQIVGMASNVDKCFELVTQFKPHLVIMDTVLQYSKQNGGAQVIKSMPHNNTTACISTVCSTIKQIQALCQHVHILIYTMFDDRRHLSDLILCGIRGHVAKSHDPDHLLQAINKIRHGSVYLSAADPSGILISHMLKSHALQPQQNLDNLSVREKEVFLLLANGASVRSIAVQLHISPKTVESHKYNVFNKLNIESLSQLTKIAIRHGLVQVYEYREFS